MCVLYAGCIVEMKFIFCFHDVFHLPGGLDFRLFPFCFFFLNLSWLLLLLPSLCQPVDFDVCACCTGHVVDWLVCFTGSGT